MPTVGNVVVKLSAESAEFSKGLKRAKQENKSFLDSLKKQYGEDSAFGNAMKLLAGAGVVAAIGLAAKSFAEVSAKAEEFYAKAREGNADVGELADEFAQSVPVIGNLYSGLKSIAGIVTGITADLHDLQADTRINDAITAAMHARISGVKELRQELGKMLDDLDHRVKGLGITGAAKDLFDSSKEYADKRADILAQTNKKISDKLGEKLKTDDGDLSLAEQLAKAKEQLNGGVANPTVGDVPLGIRMAAANAPPLQGDQLLEQSVAKMRDDYNRKKEAVERLERQINKVKEDVTAEGNAALSRLDADRAQEQAYHFKELVKEKLEAAGKAIAPVMAELAKNQNDAINASLGQFFDFEDKANEQLDELRAKAKSLVEDAKPVSQRYTELANELKGEFAAGLIDKQQYVGALAKMQNELIGDTYRKTGAVETRVAHTVPNEKSPADPLATLNNLQEKALTEQKKAANASVQIVQLMRGGTVPVVDIK